MKNKEKISILLLDDKKPHFETIKSIVKEIIQQDLGKKAEFIYTYNENKQITDCVGGNGYYHLSRYGGSDNIKKSNLQKLQALLNKIQASDSVIAIIDVNWEEDDSANRYGLDFYTDHLEKIPKENVIFISFIKKENLGRDRVLRFKYVYKSKIDEKGDKMEFGEPFKKEMRELICSINVCNKKQSVRTETVGRI